MGRSPSGSPQQCGTGEGSRGLALSFPCHRCSSHHLVQQEKELYLGIKEHSPENPWASQDFTPDLQERCPREGEKVTRALAARRAGPGPGAGGASVSQPCPEPFTSGCCKPLHKPQNSPRWEPPRESPGPAFCGKGIQTGNFSPL